MADTASLGLPYRSPSRSAAGDALTDLVLPVFELNGEFLAAAKDIAEPAGLTPAWWQVLGATLDEPLPVAEIARRVGLGLARQSVQRTADLLVEQGLGDLPRQPAPPAGQAARTDPGRSRHPAAAARRPARLGRCRRRRGRRGRAAGRAGHRAPGDRGVPSSARRPPGIAHIGGEYAPKCAASCRSTRPAGRSGPAARRRPPPGARWVTRDRDRPRPRPGRRSRPRTP